MNSSMTNATVLFSQPHASELIFNIICVAAYIIIILAAVIGNTLVCLAFCINPVLRKSPTNYFIMSLSISDILTVSLCVPFDVEQTLLDWRWNHSSAICSLWTTMYLFVVPSSILSLLAVSVDRYKCLVDPLNRFRQTRFMTRKRACMVIATLWVYSLGFALVPEMGWKMFPENVNHGSCYFNTAVEYSVLSSLLNFVLPVIVMCVLYMRIYRTVRQMRQSHEKAGISLVSEERRKGKGKQRKRLNKNVKITKNILIVVCTFFICWMPYTALTIIGVLCKSCYFSMPTELPTIFLILGYSNSALNPYLYAFRNNKFKETFTKTMRSLHLLHDSKFSSRKSYLHTNPSLLSDNSCHARNIHAPPERFTQSHPTSSV